MTPEFVANKWTMKRFRGANNPDGHSDREFYNLLLDDINALLNQPKEGEKQWIPVSERLPNVGDRYSLPCIVVHQNEVKILCFNSHDKCWDQEDGDDYFCDIGAVTHWMPLPSLPNE